MERRLSIKKVLALSAFFILTASCANIFSESADKNTDPVRLFEARKKIDAGDWTGAINQITGMTTAYQQQRHVRTLLASAYAGRCGLDVLTIIKNLQTGGTSFLQILMRAFVGATASKVADCRLAEDTINAISDNAGLRLTDENLLMTFLSFGKVGAILAASADTDADGNVDAGYNPCTALSNTEAAEIVTGLANAVISIGVAGSDIGGEQVEDLTEVCDAAADQGVAICELTDTSEVDTAQERQLIRGLVHEGQDGIGLGTCSTTPDDTITCADLLGAGCGS
ncbi:MAG: hypothetical protein AB7F59_07325 [Bdellovibrionales bacterium]